MTIRFSWFHDTRRFSPVSHIVDVTRDVDGFEHVPGFDLNGRDVFDDHFGGAGKFVAAKLVESGGADMAMDIFAVREIKFRGNGLRAGPGEEGGFDFFPIGVFADDAFARVTFGRCGHGAGKPVVESGAAAIGDVAIFAL